MLSLNASPIALSAVSLLLMLIPQDDISTRQQISFLFHVLWLSALGYFYISHATNLENIILMASPSMAAIALKHERISSLLYPLSWMLLATCTACVLTKDITSAILFAYGQILILIFALLHTGGIYRGSTSYESILFFLIIDLTAYFTLWIRADWIYWVVLLPGLSRLMFVFTAPYVRGIFYNCPTNVTILLIGNMIPVGISLLLKIPIHCPIPNVMTVASFSSSLIALMLFLAEKSRRQKAVYLFMTQSSLCIPLILDSKSIGIYLSISAMFNSVLWLYAFEYPMIRTFCTIIGGITFTWLVTQ